MRQESIVAMAKKKKSDDDEAAMPTKTRKSKKKAVEQEEEVEETSFVADIEPITFVPAMVASADATSVLEEAARQPKTKRTRGAPPPEYAAERAAENDMQEDEGQPYGFGIDENSQGLEDDAALAAARGGFGIKAASIVGQEVIDILAAVEPPPESERLIELPHELQPSNIFEQFYAEGQVEQLYWQRRRSESRAFVERALRHHHHQNRYAVNRYATTRRVSRLMAEIEEYDYVREESSPQHLPSWARAEIVFESEFEEFNSYIKDNIAEMSKREPKESEEEEVDILDDALFLLSREDDGNALNRRIDVQQEERSLADKYLDNILPGLTLSSISEAYADDIFDDEEDVVDLGPLVETTAAGSNDSMTPDVEEEEGGGDAPKKVKKVRGRAKKAPKEPEATE